MHSSVENRGNVWEYILIMRLQTWGPVVSFMSSANTPMSETHIIIATWTEAMNIQRGAGLNLQRSRPLYLDRSRKAKPTTPIKGPALVKHAAAEEQTRRTDQQYISTISK